MVKKLHSFRCEDDLWDAITAKADELGLSANEALEKMATAALGMSGPKATSEVIAPSIADLEARVRVLEKAIAKPDVRAIAAPKPAKARPMSKPIASAPGEWLTTGEAYALMQERHGYTAGQTTLRRHLRKAQEKLEVGPALQRGGISELNFEERAAANPKSNAVRWIRVC